jgi:membrane fusion protein, multidrug efflux system
MKLPNIKYILQKIKGLNYKGLVARTRGYNYKKLIDDIKKFNYKSPDAYKKLAHDKVFQKRIVWCVILIFLFTMVKGCVFKPRKKPIPPRPVTTEMIIQKDVPIYIESFGTLSSVQDVDIKAQITGQIKDVHFNDGDYISAGSPLYTIDPNEYKAQLDKAQASLAQSLADLKLKLDTLERNKSLMKRDLISKQDFETLQTDLLSAQARVDLDKAQLELANINLGYCYIVSPLNGIASKGLVDPGNIIIANDGPVLVNIKSIDSVNVDFTLSEKELSRVRDAMTKGVLSVEIRPEGDKDSYDGTLIFIDNTVDNMTGTIFVRASVDNMERKLWVGQFVTVRLILSTQKDAVLVPSAAVKIGQKGHYLFVLTDENKADLRNIKIGIKQGEYFIAEQGVKSGEKAITSGILGLYPGAAVIELPPQQPPKETDKKK